MIDPTFPQFVKDHFPLWETYCTIDGDVRTTDDVLTDEIELAEAELAKYITITTLDTVNRFHLFNLTRKRLFDLQHDASEFKNKPQILLDYEMTLANLKASVVPSFDGKPRRFGEQDGWFTDNN